MSPRLTSNLPYQLPLKATLGYCFRRDPFARPSTGADIPPRSLAVACRVPRFGPAANQRPEVQPDVFGRAEQHQVVRPWEIPPHMLHVTIHQRSCYMQQITDPFSALALGGRQFNFMSHTLSRLSQVLFGSRTSTVTTAGECRERRLSPVGHDSYQPCMR
jgi:hypothetical protein